MKVQGIRVMIDDNLIVDFTNNFYGYGNYRGKYWFIGIEEHCDGPEDSLRRFEVWGKERRELEHVADFHDKIRLGPRFFGPSCELQTTWRGLIRILLIAESLMEETEKSKEQIKKI